MTGIRPYRPGADDAALVDVCARTADAGADARGLLTEDAMWADIFLLPYLFRHPDVAVIVVDDTDTPVGYLVATDDTAAFEEWFARDWWPVRRPPSSGAGEGDVRNRSREEEILRYADGRGRGAREPWITAFPAHLHIDLLPEAQGHGWGRILIDGLVRTLRDRGVPGLHLVADAANTAAVAFYRRLGFQALDAAPESRAFGLRLADPEGS